MPASGGKESEMKLGGWQRLWLLFAALYAIPVIFFTWVEFPTADGIPHRAEFYRKLSKESLAKLVGERTSPSFVDPDEIGTTVEMPNGHGLPFRKDVTQQEISAVSHEYYDVLKAEAARERPKIIGYGVLWWLIPCVGAYALGWAIRWVYRGFRGDKTSP